MPGHFAHITLVDSICNERLEELPNLSPSLRSALANYLPYCKLGAVSPDCPAVVGQDAAAGWGNLMHYNRPADFVRYALPYLLDLPFNRAETRACLAWAFGYTAHLVADCTVHPVIECLVGPYQQNPTGHRLCEFSQDVYLVKQRTGKEIVESPFLELCGMEECAENRAKSPRLLAILDLWTHCLKQYPASEVKPYVRLPGRSIQPNVWCATYLKIMKLAASGKGLPKLLGMAYMKSDAILPRHIENLPTPKPGLWMHYDALFELAADNILAAWTGLAAALDTGDPSQFTLANADLDSGKIIGTDDWLYWVSGPTAESSA
jgi:hypothetical protein